MVRASHQSSQGSYHFGVSTQYEGWGRGARRERRDAGNGRPRAGANETMLDLVCLAGTAKQSVKRYLIFDPACR